MDLQILIELRLRNSLQRNIKLLADVGYFLRLVCYLLNRIIVQLGFLCIEMHLHFLRALLLDRLWLNLYLLLWFFLLLLRWFILLLLIFGGALFLWLCLNARILLLWRFMLLFLVSLPFLFGHIFWVFWLLIVIMIFPWLLFCLFNILWVNWITLLFLFLFLIFLFHLSWLLVFDKFYLISFVLFLAFLYFDLLKALLLLR